MNCFDNLISWHTLKSQSQLYDQFSSYVLTCGINSMRITGHHLYYPPPPRPVSKTKQNYKMGESRPRSSRLDLSDLIDIRANISIMNDDGQASSTPRPSSTWSTARGSGPPSSSGSGTTRTTRASSRWACLIILKENTLEIVYRVTGYRVAL